MDPQSSPQFPFRGKSKGMWDASSTYVCTLYQLLRHHSFQGAHPAQLHTIHPWQSLSPPCSVLLPSLSLQPDNKEEK